MSLPKRLVVVLGVALMLPMGALVPDAQAGSASYAAITPVSPYLDAGAYSFPPLTFPKFDLAGQCLTEVCVRLDGSVAGFVGLENSEAFPKTLTTNFTAQIQLLRPSFAPLVTVQPAVPTSDPVTAFDGSVDYAGTSGFMKSGLAAVAADSLCLTGSSDLALFSGAGSISLPCTATSLCTQTGANSWTFGIQAVAAGKITYTFVDCATPAPPSTWGSLKSLYR
jgi:hypothetical protein